MERATSDSPSPLREWWWIFDPRESLRARAALTVGAGALIFTILLSWITGTVFRRAMEQQLGAQFETLAFQLSDKLDRVIYERYRTLQIGANLSALRNENVPVAERHDALSALQESSTDIAWIGLADASGQVVAATNGVFERTDVSARPWFLGAREHPFIGHPHDLPNLAREVLDPSKPETSSRFVDLAVPITNANGKFGGVLAAHLYWNWARDAQLSVVSEAASRQQIGVTVYAPTGEVLLDSGASGWTQPPVAPSISEARRYRGAMFERIAGGTNYITGYARSRGVHEYRGIGWLAVVRQPVSRAFAAVEPLQHSIVAWGFVLSVIAAIAAWIGAGQHVRKLRSVRAAAERIREGDVLSVLPPPADQSEIAHMCRALGDLVEDLRAKNQAFSAENTRLRKQPREIETPKRQP
jgi:hypothetical protein